MITRVQHAVGQLVEAVSAHCGAEGSLDFEISYDEFDGDARLAYRGLALELPARRPTQAEIQESDEGERRLAGYMVAQLADRAGGAPRSCCISSIDLARGVAPRHRSQ